MIQELLIAGLDLDTRDRQGRNVVLHAAQQGSLELLRTLHDCGTDFSANDFQGKTALHMLAGRHMSHGSVGNVDYRKHIESSDLFIKAGVAASTTDYAGNTALHDAIENTGHFASTMVFLLKAVLEVGVDPEIRSKQGRTILRAAAAMPVFEHSGYPGSDCEE